MRSWTRFNRTVVSLFIAVVFAITAMPGSMAMPDAAPHSMHHGMKMDCSAGSSCDDMHQSGKDQGKPCKNMAVCLGMLGCLGMAALDSSHVAPLPAVADGHVAIAQQAISGLTLRPDNPPPIA